MKSMGWQGRPAALKGCCRADHRDHPSHHYADPAAMMAIITSRSGINMQMMSTMDMPMINIGCNLSRASHGSCHSDRLNEQNSLRQGASNSFSLPTDKLCVIFLSEWFAALSRPAEAS